MTRILTVLAVAGLALAPTSGASNAAAADPRRDAILTDLLAQAKTADPAIAGFAVDRGKAMFLATQTGGLPETTSCTVCHTEDPKAKGQSRAGKEIAPMAVSRTPDRFTDPEKIAKWFLRNCVGVLGRECTAAEKGDFITFMAAQ
jgi:Domain of unknown function (DUF1924)